jgi:hypothetical protein
MWLRLMDTVFGVAIGGTMVLTAANIPHVIGKEIEYLIYWAILTVPVRMFIAFAAKMDARAKVSNKVAA